MNKEEKRSTYGDLYAENFRLTHNNRVLQQRIDKAVEFIEKSCNHDYYYKYNGCLLKSEIKENILEILKGDSDVD